MDFLLPRDQVLATLVGQLVPHSIYALTIHEFPRENPACDTHCIWCTCCSTRLSEDTCTGLRTGTSIRHSPCTYTRSSSCQHMPHHTCNRLRIYSQLHTREEGERFSSCVHYIYTVYYHCTDVPTVQTPAPLSAMTCL